MKKTATLKPQWVTKTPATRLYQIPIPIIGLTGGIATGKSTVSELFRKEGIPIIDADKLVKSIYQTKEAHDFVATHFPDVISDRQINFKLLREKVFSSEKNQILIENFIYQRLPETFKKTYEAFPPAPFIVYDVPLLFEKKLNSLVDLSVCVYAPKDIQIKRLVARDQITPELAEKILTKQMDIEQKKSHSDLVINNIGDMNQLKKNFVQLLKDLF